jgi:hypothetical protein
LANTLGPRDLSRGDGILGSSGLPKLISGHILSKNEISEHDSRDDNRAR